MAILQLQDVTYTYPTASAPSLQQINLSIETGEFVAVIGANGAGKSTLAYTFTGYVPHFYKGQLSGSVRLAGIDVTASSLPEMVEIAGLVFQNPFNQISGARYTVYEEVAFGLENLGVAQEEMPSRIDAALQAAGITSLASRSPYALSGGQMQRVALASILVMQPKVLVLDEPTAQLDPAGSREVFEVIRGMAHAGQTIVIIEHKLEWIAEYADRVIVMHHGRIALDGSPAAVLADPRLEGWGIGGTRYTQAARLAQSKAKWPTGAPIPVTLDQAVKAFRAETNS